MLLFNDLTGTIPESIVQLTKLTDLRLSWNQLTGTIPSKIGLLTKLEILDLSINSDRSGVCQCNEAVDVALYLQ